MNSSAGLTNLNLHTPELLKFKGIRNGQMTNIFSNNAELNSSLKFGRKVSEMVAKKINKKTIETLQENHDYRKELAERRAQILGKKTKSQLNIEEELLKLVEDTTFEQEKKGKTFVAAKPLLKQIQDDIRIYFTNEIRKCTSQTGLIQLFQRIKLLTPTSKFDRAFKHKLDSKSIKMLQSELDRQTNRVVDQLKFDLDPKRNRASDEINLDLEKNSTHSAADILEKRCHDIIGWIESIQEISAKTFSNRRRRMCQLLSETYQTGLNSITHHPTDLIETQKSYSKVIDLSNKIKETIKNTIDKNEKLLSKISDATLLKKNSLEKELGQLQTAADKYETFSNTLKKYNTEVQNIEEERTALNEKIITKQKNKKRLEEIISSGNILKRTFPSLFNRQNYLLINNINKDLSALAKKDKVLIASSNKAMQALNKARNDTDIAHQDFQELVNRYGASLKGLDGLGDVQVDDQGIPISNNVLTALHNWKKQASTATAMSTTNMVNALSDEFKKNKSILNSPDHLNEITSFVNKKLSSNPEVSNTLPQFLEIYSQLLQPQSDGREWSFNQTFRSFIEGCEKLSDKDSSVEEAQQHLFQMVVEKHSQHGMDDVSNKVISSDLLKNTGAAINSYLTSINKERLEPEFGIDAVRFDITDIISGHPELVKLPDHIKTEAADKIYRLDNPSTEKIRDILNEYIR